MGPFEGPDYRWPSVKNEYLVEIDDITQDVDTPDQYESLLEAIKLAVPRAAKIQ